MYSFDKEVVMRRLLFIFVWGAAVGTIVGLSGLLMKDILFWIIIVPSAILASFTASMLFNE